MEYYKWTADVYAISNIYKKLKRVTKDRRQIIYKII